MTRKAKADHAYTVRKQGERTIFNLIHRHPMRIALCSGFGHLFLTFGIIAFVIAFSVTVVGVTSEMAQAMLTLVWLVAISLLGAWGVLRFLGHLNGHRTVEFNRQGVVLGGRCYGYEDIKSIGWQHLHPGWSRANNHAAEVLSEVYEVYLAHGRKKIKLARGLSDDEKDDIYRAIKDEFALYGHTYS
ncbi:MAG: hypothetical protein ACFB6R_03230 [Alphaproteobacteria bacterium]